MSLQPNGKCAENSKSFPVVFDAHVTVFTPEHYGDLGGLTPDLMCVGKPLRL
jgi:hypothetical protein